MFIIHTHRHRKRNFQENSTNEHDAMSINFQRYVECSSIAIVVVIEFVQQKNVKSSF